MSTKPRMLGVGSGLSLPQLCGAGIGLAIIVPGIIFTGMYFVNDNSPKFERVVSGITLSTMPYYMDYSPGDESSMNQDIEDSAPVETYGNNPDWTQE